MKRREVSICVMEVTILPLATKWIWNWPVKSLRKVHGDWEPLQIIINAINSLVALTWVTWIPRREIRICRTIRKQRALRLCGHTGKIRKLVRILISLPVWIMHQLVMKSLIWAVGMIRNSTLKVHVLLVLAIRVHFLIRTWLFRVHLMFRKIHATLLFHWQCLTWIYL